MTYDENSIQQLPRHEVIRKRPQMYLGGTDANGLYHMFEEIIDGMLEFALAGLANHINIIVRNGFELHLRVNGPGISIRYVTSEQKYLLELICMYGHFSDRYEETGSYRITGGLHGMGISAVNALSEWMHVEDRRDGHLWELKFQRGQQQGSFQQTRALEEGEETGIAITFKPDFTILQPNDFDFDRIAERCHEAAYQIPHLTVHLWDERTTPGLSREFHEPEGIVALVTAASLAASPINAPINAAFSTGDSRHPYHYDQMEAECSLVFTREKRPVELGHVNTIRTTHGGTHIEGVRQGILKYFNQARSGQTTEYRWDKIAPHLVLAVRLLHGYPQYPSMAVLELLNPEVTAPIAYSVYLALEEFAEQHPDEWQEILSACGNL